MCIDYIIFFLCFPVNRVQSLVLSKRSSTYSLTQRARSQALVEQRASTDDATPPNVDDLGVFLEDLHDPQRVWRDEKSVLIKVVVVVVVAVLVLVV